jgi:hypothetical protein
MMSSPALYRGAVSAPVISLPQPLVRAESKVGRNGGVEMCRNTLFDAANTKASASGGPIKEKKEPSAYARAKQNLILMLGMQEQDDGDGGGESGDDETRESTDWRPRVEVNPLSESPRVVMLERNSLNGDALVI